MNSIYGSLAAGALLAAFAAVLIRIHLRSLKNHLADPSLTERERGYYRTQFRRRIQIAAILALIGLLIPLADALIVNQIAPLVSTLILMGILILSLWIMVLAMFDWYSSRLQMRSLTASIASLAHKRRELEAELARLKAQSTATPSDATQSNGPPSRGSADT
jgi:cell division protein FtsL